MNVKKTILNFYCVKKYQSILLNETVDLKIKIDFSHDAYGAAGWSGQMAVETFSEFFLVEECQSFVLNEMADLIIKMNFSRALFIGYGRDWEVMPKSGPKIGLKIHPRNYVWVNRIIGRPVTGCRRSNYTLKSRIMAERLEMGSNGANVESGAKGSPNRIFLKKEEKRMRRGRELSILFGRKKCASRQECYGWKNTCGEELRSVFWELGYQKRSGGGDTSSEQGRGGGRGAHARSVSGVCKRKY
jgi:hypothetical protein